MRPERRPRRTAGLTLIELIITVTILAIAGAIVAQAFTTALGTWRRGVDHGREELAARIVASRVAEQLRSAVQTWAERGGNDAVAFEAGESLVRFVTTLSSRGPAPAAVSYRIVEHEGRPALAYREHAWPDKEFFEDPAAQREEIVPEVESLAVSVTARADEFDERPGRVPEEWRPEDGVLPATVTVSVRTAPVGGEGEGRTATVTVALPAEGVP